MGRKKEGLLTKSQLKKLEKMTKDMLEIAANVVEEYEDLDLSELSELSSSITQINENSPLYLFSPSRLIKMFFRGKIGTK